MAEDRGSLTSAEVAPPRGGEKRERILQSKSWRIATLNGGRRCDTVMILRTGPRWGPILQRRFDGNFADGPKTFGLRISGAAGIVTSNPTLPSKPGHRPFVYLAFAPR